MNVNEDWVGVFDEYGVRFLVLDRHDDSDLLDLFRSQPGWTVDFEDEVDFQHYISNKRETAR